MSDYEILELQQRVRRLEKTMKAQEERFSLVVGTLKTLNGSVKNLTQTCELLFAWRDGLLKRIDDLKRDMMGP